MKVFLRYVADPGVQYGIGEEMEIHQSSVRKVIGDVLQNIVDKAHFWIKSPKSENEMRLAQEKWQQICYWGLYSRANSKIEKSWS